MAGASDERNVLYESHIDDDDRNSDNESKMSLAALPLLIWYVPIILS